MGMPGSSGAGGQVVHGSVSLICSGASSAGQSFSTVRQVIRGPVIGTNHSRGVLIDELFRREVYDVVECSYRGRARTSTQGSIGLDHGRRSIWNTFYPRVLRVEI